MIKKKVLFLCTGNSCRSQMAEALVNEHLGDQWEAVSAGTKPAGFVHPMALAVLEELSIPHDGRSKMVDEFIGVDFDLVVTVCDSAAEDCPVWLGKGGKAHRSFPDPAEANGSEEEIKAIFRWARDDIERDIIQLLSQ